LPLYLPLLVVKLVAVLAYAGGLCGRFLTSEPAAQKRAVHAVASPAIAVVWATGLALASMSNVPLTELWIVMGLGLSLISLLALIAGVSRPIPMRIAFLSAAVPLLLVLIAMVYRPRWSDF
jgi:hypothetical protein